MRIRKFQNADLASLATIYRASIQRLGDEHYSHDQIVAWSSFPNDMEAFEKWLAKATTFVAVCNDDMPIAFGGLEANGRISSLFVAPEMMRKGVGSALLEHLINEAKSRRISTLTTEASEFSKGLFEKFGFRVREIEQTEYNGVKFSRYAMQRDKQST